MTRLHSPRWRRITSSKEQKVFYEDALPAVRRRARQLGYAIGVHGSMLRDLDLIAVPWIEIHADRDTLARTIQRVISGYESDEVIWEQKPCGRFTTSLPVCMTTDERPNAGHVDLSVYDSL